MDNQDIPKYIYKGTRSQNQRIQIILHREVDETKKPKIKNMDIQNQKQHKPISKVDLKLKDDDDRPEITNDPTPLIPHTQSKYR